jgi:hypothetical protein
MTPEQQRIAIAEACGWTEMRMGASDLIGTSPDGRISWQLPDYLNDLNAMHEAEKVLTKEQRWEYIGNLGTEEAFTWTCLHATAAQRAEAFLKTLNL